MKYVISRYNHDTEWIKEYTNDVVIYDRSELPLSNAIKVENRGSDILDKFSYIIQNYDNLPDVAVYTKCNLFKYITKEEFDQVKDNKIFTPLLTQKHKTYLPVCWYEDGMYCEFNNYWYLNSHPAKWARQIKDFFKMDKREYNKFAPGSNYILPKENILKHSKSVYQELRSYLEWAIYPGDAQLLERNLYYLWK